MATTCEKILQEVPLQRSELSEAGEGFDVKKQVGSSTMAHKKNPIKSNASGLVVNCSLVHHTNLKTLFGMSVICNVSSERFTRPTRIVRRCHRKTRQVLTNMWVDAERCMENILAQRGLVMAEKVMIDLVERGVPRDEAHEILREASFTAVANKEELIDVCSRTPAISAAFSAEELEAMFEPSNHIGVSGELVDEAVALARAAIQTTE